MTELDRPCDSLSKELVRVQRQIAGREMEVVYEIRGEGHGVTAISVNGQRLAFTHDPNPYRTGAARVTLEELGRQLIPGRNVMVIAVG